MWLKTGLMWEKRPYHDYEPFQREWSCMRLKAGLARLKVGLTYGKLAYHGQELVQHGQKLIRMSLPPPSSRLTRSSTFCRWQRAKEGGGRDLFWPSLFCCCRRSLSLFTSVCLWLRKNWEKERVTFLIFVCSSQGNVRIKLLHHISAWSKSEFDWELCWNWRPCVRFNSSWRVKTSVLSDPP